MQKTADSLSHLMQSINLQEKRYLNQSLIAISMGLRQPKQVNQSRPSVNVNNSGVNINLNPVNVNNSAVNVNLNPNINVNNSLVNVRLDPPAPVYNNFNVNNSVVDVSTSDNKIKMPINVNNSSVDVQL